MTVLSHISEHINENSNRTFDNEITQFLNSGDYDFSAELAPGQNICEKMENQREMLLSALINEVNNRSKKCKKIFLPDGFDLIQFTRRKCAPMVNGQRRDIG